MSSSLKQIVQREFRRILLYQMGLLVGLSIIVTMSKGQQAGMAVATGGLSYWAPTALFMWLMAVTTRVAAVQEFLFAFVGGEALKLTLSATLFVLAIHYCKLSIPYALFGLLGAIIAFWIASIFATLPKRRAS